MHLSRPSSALLQRVTHLAKDYLFHPRELAYALAARGLIPCGDERYIRHIYRRSFGRDPDLTDPHTYNEKLQWLKLHDRDPAYRRIVDKAEAKRIIAETFGSEYVVPTLGVYERFDDIPFSRLPDRFVIKCTHDSQSTVICRDRAAFDLAAARRRITRCLRRNYYYRGREWPYRDVRPRIMVEALLDDGHPGGLVDYKFSCFNGQCRMIFTCTDRESEGGIRVTFFDRDWNRMPFRKRFEPSTDVRRPAGFVKMRDMAEQLAAGLPFLRVDFYEADGQVYFGEMTFYPANGLEPFIPEEWDGILGSWIDLKLAYDYRKDRVGPARSLPGHHPR